MATRVQETLNQILPHLRYEPTSKWIRAQSGGLAVVNTRRALLLWEPMRATPVYAVPVNDVTAQLIKSSLSSHVFDGSRLLFPHDAFLLHSTDGEVLDILVADQLFEGAAFSFADPDLNGYIELDFEAFEWFEEDELLFAHARDPFHRIDVRSSSREVRVEFNGVILAETSTPEVLFETRLPERYYVPRYAVNWDELEPTASVSYCPYKGRANYWKAHGTEIEVAWSYDEPVRGLERLAGLVCFYNERVDLFVDTLAMVRPASPFG